MKNDDYSKRIIRLPEIPLESNLGLLAYGDVAFTAWRTLKKASKSNKMADEEE